MHRDSLARQGGEVRGRFRVAFRPTKRWHSFRRPTLLGIESLPWRWSKKKKKKMQVQGSAQADVTACRSSLVSG